MHERDSELVSLKERVTELEREREYLQVGPTHLMFQGPHAQTNAFRLLNEGKISCETYRHVKRMHALVGQSKSRY